jgi:hypothetical protein
MQRENIFLRKWFWNNSPYLEELQQWISGDYLFQYPDSTGKEIRIGFW